MAEPPQNSLKYPEDQIKKLMSRISEWHVLLGENPKMLESWLLDQEVPFEIPELLLANQR
jgi:hypothetical protein